MKIHLGNSFYLPLDVVTQSLGILAKRRAGKSYTGRRFAEQLFKAGLPIVIVDPKGDWWGIRSSADGKSPGLPIVILGGEHKDVPLETGSGEVVAKLVVHERVSVLLDLAEFRKHEVSTFMTAFLENLYRLKAREEYRTPVMLIIDEADAIAPQKPQKGEERMLGAAEDIVRRGGQRGIGCTLITQRSAVLNKNVLTQTQILVPMRTIAPQDLDALKSWVDVHGTQEERKTLMESLPSLPTGTAWFWSPGWPTEEGIFKRVEVLPIETFDSGATPKPGEKRIQPKNLADVDLQALRNQMAETIERGKAEDPRELKKQIAELRKNLIDAHKRAARDLEQVSKPKLERVEVPILKDSQIKQLESIADRFEKLSDRHKEESLKLGEAAVILRACVKDAMGKPAPQMIPKTITASRPAVDQPKQKLYKPVAISNGNLGKCETSILAVLNQSPEGCTKSKIALLAGYSVTSGGFSNSLGALRTSGLLVGENTGVMRITEAGREKIADTFTPLPQGAELIEYWANNMNLSKSAREVFRFLASIYPRAATKEEIAEATGYSVSSGGFSNSLGELRTASLIQGRNTEPMIASETLFEE